MTTAEKQAFEQLRQQTRDYYERILQARDWVKTARTRTDAFGPLKSVADQTVQPILNALDELVKVGTDQYEKFAPVEWDYVEIADHDADIWKQIKAATNVVKQGVADINDDRARVTSEAEARANAMDRARAVGPVDPTQPAPWGGSAGRAYTTQIPAQATAAQFIGELADIAGELMRQTSENFHSLISALKNLMEQILMFWILLVASLIDLGYIVIDAIFFPPVQLALAVSALVAFGATFTQRLTQVAPAITNYQTAMDNFHNNTNRRIQDLRNKLADAPDVFRYSGASSPQWPDPTHHGAFPGVTQSRGGNYELHVEHH
ncbi:hypothetical protein GCM10023322_28040 [Rugosimonospora acidiphila]|uniref:ESX-1 secretion-associated protein EspA/EspE-like domain-containing protein n=1 Tax=Rugosimonospora acidiphila TaxID=556531 RepID=A0ABP9RQY0_9ACTN